MNWLSIQQRLMAGFALVFVIFALGVVLAYISEKDEIRGESWVRHTLQVREGLAGVVTKAVDLETGTRGFVIAGKEDFLKPYFDARASIPNELNRIRDLTVDNPLQRSRVAGLERLIVVQLEHHAEIVRAAKEKGLEVGRQLVSAGHGEEAMDAIREAVEEMKAEETRLLRSRENTSRSDGHRSWILIFCAGFGYQATGRSMLTLSGRDERLARHRGLRIYKLVGFGRLIRKDPMRFPDEINQAPATAGVYILENSDRTTNHVWYTDNLQQELRRIANLAADPRKDASEFSCEVIPDPQQRERRARELLHTLKPTTQEE